MDFVLNSDAIAQCSALLENAELTIAFSLINEHNLTDSMVDVLTLWINEYISEFDINNEIAFGDIKNDGYDKMFLTYTNIVRHINKYIDLSKYDYDIPIITRFGNKLLVIAAFN